MPYTDQKKQSKQWRDKNKEHLADYRRCQKYNISKEHLSLMRERQQFRCAWCGKEKLLCVDHDRSCCPGKFSCGRCVRRLLCDSCNKAEGLLKDNPEIIAAIEAVAFWKAEE